MSVECIKVRLRYLYPESDRSFFRAREFHLVEDELLRTGLFGGSADIAGVVIATDSMHIQFNESDVFGYAHVNALWLEVVCPITARPYKVQISNVAGFLEYPELEVRSNGYQISFAGREVGPEHFLRLEWAF